MHEAPNQNSIGKKLNAFLEVLEEETTQELKSVQKDLSRNNVEDERS